MLRCLKRSCTSKQFSLPQAGDSKDWRNLRKCGAFLVDKTKYIHVLHKAATSTSPFFLLLRPKRFGKSLFLSTLGAFYDINNKGDFKDLFGEGKFGRATEIYQVKDELAHSRYLVLNWDFSSVQRGTEQLELTLKNKINQALYEFLINYTSVLQKYCHGDERLPNSFINVNDCVDSLQAVCDLVSRLVRAQSEILGIVLLVDEYDAISNEYIAESTHAQYKQIGAHESLLKALFAKVKEETGRAIRMTLATGVAPLALADHTSGLNIVRNMSHQRPMAAVCGFNRRDVDKLFEDIASINPGLRTALDHHRKIVDHWYNGYSFVEGEEKLLYNTDGVLRYARLLLQGAIENESLAHGFASELSGFDDLMIIMARHQLGPAMLNEALAGPVLFPGRMLDRGIHLHELLDLSRDQDGRLLKTLAYHFGALTHSQNGLAIPNEAVRSSIVENTLSYAEFMYSDVARVHAAVRGLVFQDSGQLFADYVLESVLQFGSINPEHDTERVFHIHCDNIFRRYGSVVQRNVEFEFANKTRADQTVVTFEATRRGLVLEYKHINIRNMDLDKASPKFSSPISWTQKRELVAQRQKYLQDLSHDALMLQPVQNQTVGQLLAAATLQCDAYVLQMQSRSPDIAWCGYVFMCIGSARVVWCKVPKRNM